MHNSMGYLGMLFLVLFSGKSDGKSFFVRGLVLLDCCFIVKSSKFSLYWRSKEEKCEKTLSMVGSFFFIEFPTCESLRSDVGPFHS